MGDWSKDADGTPIFRGIKATGTVKLPSSRPGSRQCAYTWPEETRQVIEQEANQAVGKAFGRALLRRMRERK